MSISFGSRGLTPPDGEFVARKMELAVSPFSGSTRGLVLATNYPWQCRPARPKEIDVTFGSSAVDRRSNKGNGCVPGLRTRTFRLYEASRHQARATTTSSSAGRRWRQGLRRSTTDVRALPATRGTVPSHSGSQGHVLTQEPLAVSLLRPVSFGDDDEPGFLGHWASGTRNGSNSAASARH